MAVHIGRDGDACVTADFETTVSETPFVSITDAAECRKAWSPTPENLAVLAADESAASEMPDAWVAEFPS